MSQVAPLTEHFRSLTPATLSRMLLLGLLLTPIAGCGFLPKEEANAQPAQRGQAEEGPAAVDVAIARTAPLGEELEYTGTTQPFREVSLRAQVEGQLVSLSADVGDPIARGEVVARLDDQVLTAAVVGAQAEVAAQEAEVAQARTEVSDAQTLVEQSRLELQQAQSDLARFQGLYEEGVIPEQQVEQARTAVGTAEQAFRSAQEQVRTRQQAVTAAERRVIAQQAAVAQEQERRAYSVLTSPIDGYVLERVTEPGNLVQPGGELLRLGDFSQVKISVQVSELELANIQTGQVVQVRLDAFPGEGFVGRVTRISPAADPTARLVPVEVAIPNNSGRIGSGLLARVNFTQQAAARVVVPETALRANQERGPRGGARGGGGRPAGGPAGGASQRPSESPQPLQAGDRGTVFVVAGSGEAATVEERTVTVGDRRDGRVEIIAGLEPGEAFVARSSQGLKDGDTVRTSVLSEGVSGSSRSEAPGDSR